MVDFIEAFKEGQTAAEIAKKNKHEIISVFKELNAQLKKATDGKIRINLGFAIQGLVKKDPSQISEKFKSISAENPTVPNSHKEELVKWEQAREGYPCKITIGNKQHYCEDKTELENALALMLQDPIVAKTLSKLMSLSQN
jgi:hypothetical protein